MFENLADRLQEALGKLTNKGKLTEKDIDAAMREVRLALLEADVNYKVVKDFVKETKAKALGEDVMSSLTPGQMVVKIVRDQLVELMSDENQRLTFSQSGPTVLMMCGLQGAGKTTHAGKLAKFLSKKGKSPLLVACDVYRPAAVDQLKVVGKQVDTPVYEEGTGQDPVEIAKNGLAHAKENKHDLVIIDTAGRLQIDEELMQELQDIKEAVQVDETLLVVDAMTGQEAVNVAETFNQEIGIDGIIMSKLDGDARGGAALSVRAVTKKPIKFIGTGEKLDDLEEFHPDRLVSRILGMGDMLTLIERAEQAFDEERAKELESKMREQTYDLNDFLEQMDQMKGMGDMNEILAMIPGLGNKAANLNISEKQMAHVEAIILSMTPEERRKPELINKSRRERIAQGSGRSPIEVNRLLKQFKQMKKMMKQINQQSKKSRGFFNNPFF